MQSEPIVRALHAARPGATSAALARAGSYARLWRRVEDTLAARGRRLDAGGESRMDARSGGRLDPRILDLACGDWAMPGAIGCDLSREELARGSGRSTGGGSGSGSGSGSGARVQGRAQALPFADGAFDAALCHLAFMLLDNIETVVSELHRVLALGATFHALLGGGPVALGPGEPEDAFHVFAQLMPKAPPLGDARSKSEAGWRALFAESRGWSAPTFERWELDLTGSFDDVWLFLGASYSLREADRVKRELRVRFPDDPVPCRVACYYARVTR